MMKNKTLKMPESVSKLKSRGQCVKPVEGGEPVIGQQPPGGG